MHPTTYATFVTAFLLTAVSAAPTDVQAFLDLHNKFRAPRNAGAMTWNQTLADAAQKQANTCVFKHSEGKFGPFGENLASKSGSISPEEAMKMWGPDEEGISSIKTRIPNVC